MSTETNLSREIGEIKTHLLNLESDVREIKEDMRETLHPRVSKSNDRIGVLEKKVARIEGGTTVLYAVVTFVAVLCSGIGIYLFIR